MNLGSRLEVNGSFFVRIPTYTGTDLVPVSFTKFKEKSWDCIVHLFRQKETGFVFGRVYVWGLNETFWYKETL